MTPKKSSLEMITGVPVVRLFRFPKNRCDLPHDLLEDFPSHLTSDHLPANAIGPRRHHRCPIDQVTVTYHRNLELRNAILKCGHNLIYRLHLLIVRSLLVCLLPVAHRLLLLAVTLRLLPSLLGVKPRPPHFHVDQSLLDEVVYQIHPTRLNNPIPICFERTVTIRHLKLRIIRYILPVKCQRRTKVHH